MEKKTIEDSFFYTEYAGELNKNVTLHFSKSFYDALSNHLQGKYPNLLNNRSEHNLGASIKVIIEDYLQKRCLTRKSFNGSIFALIDSDNIVGGNDLNKDNIECEFCAFGVTPKLQESYNQVVAARTSSDEFDFDMVYNYDYHIARRFQEKSIDEFKDAKECSNVDIVELQINNYLDSYIGGVYTNDMENETIHCGANLLETNDGSFCGVVYIWQYNFSFFSPVVNNIGLVDIETLLRWLKAENLDMYKEFKRLSLLIPSDSDLDSLKEQIKEDELQIEMLKERINKNKAILKKS